MKSRYLLTLIVLVAAVLLVLVFWGGPRAAQGSGQNLVVLCSSCSFPGLPQEGHLVLMDSSSGDIWIYSDAAIEGKQQPIHWGKLVLGQPIERSKR
jgi:hypothetical protein